MTIWSYHHLQNDHLIISPFAEGQKDHLIISSFAEVRVVRIYTPRPSSDHPLKEFCQVVRSFVIQCKVFFFWLVSENPEDIRSLWMIRTPSWNHLSFCLKTASLFNEKYLLYCKKLADNTNTFVESSRLLFENCPFSHLNIFFHNSKQAIQIMACSIFYHHLEFSFQNTRIWIPWLWAWNTENGLIKLLDKCLPIPILLLSFIFEMDEWLNSSCSRYNIISDKPRPS